MRRSSGSSSVIPGPAAPAPAGCPAARTGAHIADRDVRGHHLGQHRAVQQVPFPQPGTSRGPISPRRLRHRPAARHTRSASPTRAAPESSAASVTGLPFSSAVRAVRVRRRHRSGLQARPRLDGAERRSGRSAGSTTTQRWGSSPSDSLRSPAAATASCTTLRSNGVIGRSLTGSPVSLTSCAASRPARASSLALRARNPAMSSISRLRSPVSRCTASRVSSCSASSTSPSRPTSLLQSRLDAVADDRHRRTVALDVHVDVPVEVGDVQQPLQVVRRDLTLLLQAGHGRPLSGLAVAVVSAHGWAPSCYFLRCLDGLDLRPCRTACPAAAAWPPAGRPAVCADDLLWPAGRPRRSRPPLRALGAVLLSPEPALGRGGRIAASPCCRPGGRLPLWPSAAASAGSPVRGPPRRPSWPRSPRAPASLPLARSRSWRCLKARLPGVGLRWITYICWPMVHTLVVSQ